MNQQSSTIPNDTQENLFFSEFSQEIEHILGCLNQLVTLYESISEDLKEEQITRLVNKILEIRNAFTKQEKRVAVSGVFNAGKSTLINALLGEKILPSRNNRATGVITEITKGAKSSAKIYFADKRKAQSKYHYIPIEDIKNHILLNTSDTIATSPENIARVVISLPNFFLPQDCYLLDTPGLLDNDTLTNETLKAIQTIDLAIIVLRADKLLLEKERIFIEEINNLLNGNVIFIINRMGLICQEDEDEDPHQKILEWANNFLQYFGNDFTGKPTIITTDALHVLKQARNLQEPDPSYTIGIENLKLKLQELLNSFYTERFIISARIGKIENTLRQLVTATNNYVLLLQDTIDNLQKEDNQEWQTKVLLFSQIFSKIWMIIDVCKNQSINELNTVINAMIKGSYNALSSDSTDWAQRVRWQWEKENKKYISRVNKRIESALKEMPIKTQNKYKDYQKLRISSDKTSVITSLVGGSATLSSVRNLRNIIFQDDVRERLFDNVKHELLLIKNKMMTNLEEYFNSLQKPISSYEKDYQPIYQESQKSLEFQQSQSLYLLLSKESESLLDYIDNFKKQIQKS